MIGSWNGSAASFTYRLYDHVLSKFRAIQKGPQVFQRLGDERSIRTLNGGHTRRPDFFWPHAHVADDGPPLRSTRRTAARKSDWSSMVAVFKP